MKKVYIVSSTNEMTGYEQNYILTPFSTKEKAKAFFEKEKERIAKEIGDNPSYEVIDDKEDYYLVGTERQSYWYEVILIEKDLN